MRITTTYKTNSKGTGQIVAKGGKRQKTVNYDHALTPRGNHLAAARHIAPVFPGEHTIELDSGRATFVV